MEFGQITCNTEEKVTFGSDNSKSEKKKQQKGQEEMNKQTEKAIVKPLPMKSRYKDCPHRPIP